VPELDDEEQLSKKKLQEMIVGLISLFREELEKLTQEEQMAASRTLDDLSKPCQFMVIWMKDPEFQIALITHLTQLEDKHIEVYGPLENLKLPDYIEDKVLKSPMIEFLGRERVEEFLIFELGNVNLLFDPLHGIPQPTIYRKSRLSSDPYGAFWFIKGNLITLDTQKLVEEAIKGIKSAAQQQPSQSPPPSKPILEGFGTYIKPPIWIGEIPRPKSFKEKMESLPLSIRLGSGIIPISTLMYLGERVITDNYKNRPLIVTRSGYISIGERDRTKALELINEIMSTMHLHNIKCQVVREIELGNVTFTESGALFDINPFILTTQRNEVSEEQIKKSVKLAERLTEDHKTKTLLLFFLEAFSHFSNTEFKQALTAGWLVCEIYIKDSWATYTSKLPPKRRKKLEGWDVDKKMEVLNLRGMLQDDDYNLLEEIKLARNKLSHEGEPPPRDIVEKCVNLSFEIVKKYAKKRLGGEDIAF